MNASTASSNRAAWAAAGAAATMIAHQVGAKAVRDAMFLSNFDISALPAMIVAASLVSIVMLLGSARILSRRGPAWFVPRAFAVSAGLLLTLWATGDAAPRVTAVLFYLHVASFGAVLVSAFWSMTNEAFDPRTARKRMSRIAMGATLGGLAGGLAAERLANTLSVHSMLPLLAALHVVCAVGIVRFLNLAPVGSQAQTGTGGVRAGLREIGRVPYLRDLALLVLTATMGAAFLDYLFKAQAAARVTDSATLVRFFAAFYTGASLLTFIVQSTASRWFLERLGLARTVSSLPAAIFLGGIATWAVPGLASGLLARGGESVMRSSLFRSAYEPLYTPLTPDRKRAAKSFIDVGCDRLGDALGGALIRLLLFAAPAIAMPLMGATAAALGVIGLFIAWRLHGGYTVALEKSLRAREIELDPTDLSDLTTKSMVMQTLTSFDASDLSAALKRSGAAQRSSAASSSAPAAITPTDDALLARVADLRSGDARRTYRALELHHAPEPELVGHIIPLLAWDEIAGHASRSLRLTKSRAAGQLVDALLDPDQEFSTRRRIPRVLGSIGEQRVVDGLVAALTDRRFEVRYQCGRALLRLRRKHDSLIFDEEIIFSRVMHEARVDRAVWTSQRLLDGLDPTVDSDDPFLDDTVRERSTRSLEHVFTLLALVLPRTAVLVAYKGLLTDDQNLKGTALEYLEHVLPSAVRKTLWPFLEEGRPPKPAAPAGREVVDRLLQSHESIQLNLAELRREQGNDPAS